MSGSARAAKRQSTIDLFEREFVLLTGTGGSHFIGQVASAASALGVPLQSVVVSEPEWQPAYGVSADGAVLIRLDGHVAWRAPTIDGLNPRDLHEVFSRLLCRTVQ